MNFLAHIYLSGDDTLLKIGNFVADSIRGKDYLNYPTKIQQGVILHREIDTYTDAHEIWRKSKKLIVPKYNHYAAVLIDMYYDHFLAKNWDQYSFVSLEEYAHRFYTELQENFDVLPVKVQNFLHIMLEENWLVKYRSIEGLKYILTQMDRRTKGISKMSLATTELIEHYKTFEEHFSTFFTELQKHLIDFRKTERYLLK
ncbi:acyl carrier protein phosphodiesterase [Myroides odoratimimus]|uniref:acyl carrier protein phosphodiesterase n=1 Tax=Myroides odoratimimus TaxID=76832 RepID=UPI00046941AD|nr:acyl carrier protein phosphodiesterase [Myroides odoratimimus]